jgi:hypothetical protein
MRKSSKRIGLRRRSGVAALDYVLVVGIIFPLAVTIFYFGPKIIDVVYEMVGTMVAWPFM